MEGTIQFVNLEKAYGFIKRPSDPVDGKGIFFHIKNFRPQADFQYLKKGDRVGFDVVETEKGLAAENVELI